MCNHSERKQTFWTYNEELEGFVLESIIDIKAGLEIVDSYGKKYNSKFLLNYGFVIQDNDLSEVVNLALFRLCRFLTIWSKIDPRNQKYGKDFLAIESC